MNWKALEWIDASVARRQTKEDKTARAGSCRCSIEVSWIEPAPARRALPMTKLFVRSSPIFRYLTITIWLIHQRCIVSEWEESGLWRALKIEWKEIWTGKLWRLNVYCGTTTTHEGFQWGSFVRKRCHITLNSQVFYP